MALFPPRPDVRVTIESYVQELESTPAFWLRRACRVLADDTNREWLPRPGHIKAEAAKQFAEYRHREQYGLPYDPTAIHRRLAVGRELHLMKQGPVDTDRQLTAGGEK